MKIMKNIFKFLRKDGIGEPPWEYNFLYNLPQSEYSKYLAKIFNYRTGEKLPLCFDFSKKAWIIDKKKCKTFNQKIQWIKLYGVTDLMRDCTDKVKVRDYVKEKIGEEYLKPVLQIIPNESHETVCCHCEQVNDNLGLAWQSRDISNDTLDCRADIKVPSSARNDRKSDDVSTYFDQIDFDKLPDSFVLKCNHGSKWHYIIKNKNEYLKNERLFDITKKQMTGWLEQDYCFWNGFEMNYHNIKPKILIEPLMRDEINTEPVKINVYCFNGKPEIFIKFFENNKMSIWNGKFEQLENIFNFSEENTKMKFDDLINQTFVLSKQLAEKFNIVRIDWMLFKNKLYFVEMTFTPYSGFKNIDNELNKLIKI